MTMAGELYAAEARPVAPAVSGGGKLTLFLLALVIVVIAEAIGNVSIPVGSGKIVLLPLLWALLLGGALGLMSPRLPAPLRLSGALQNAAGAYLQPALLIFIAKLGLLVGGSLPKILASGWALAFQEFGHFFGTMVFGLPVALLLGIKREAIGATFSVGREPSLAIIGERYGMDSPEGRGVLAEYLTGTVFGAVFIALLAGLVTSLGIFNPLALAMGAGVGSGSMMAAASGRSRPSRRLRSPRTSPPSRRPATSSPPRSARTSRCSCRCPSRSGPTASWSRSSAATGRTPPARRPPTRRAPRRRPRRPIRRCGSASARPCSPGS